MSHIRRNLLAVVMAAGALAACTGTGGSKTTVGQYVDDATVTAKVKTAIANDAGLGTAAAINVNSYNGTVQLTGFVDNQEDVRKAVSAAKTVPGVQEVKNDLMVKSSVTGGSSGRSGQ